jgi:hypothetical protein
MIRPINKENIKSGLIRLFSVIKKDKGYYLLVLFLIAVLLISFVLPYLYFGRLYGTDDYTHLFHTERMAATTSMSSFYQNMIDEVSNTASDINPFYYPFGMWLFGSEIIKMTGLPAIDAVMLFVILFLILLICAFYVYSGLFLTTREQKLIALLFFISMPNMALLALSYRPSVFTIPFLLVIIYIAFREPMELKLIPLMLLSIFIIVVCHTGTFIFLIAFAIIYFLVYCLVWGKFSWPFYLTIISSFVIYVVTLGWFPQISYQYADKSSLFLTVGDFFSSKFNFLLAGDMGKVFYENLFVGQQLIFALIFGAILFTIGWILISVHQHIAAFFTRSDSVFPLALPIQNISHTLIATPIWLGPVQCVMSLFGIFQLDSKGKCLLISTLACTLLPNVFQSSAGIVGSTGALREVDYLIIIIPITAALGFWKVITYVKESTLRYKTAIISAVWITVLLSVIFISALATCYYLPKIAGEDYIIDGMKWLGQNGDYNEKVVGYGYRTVPIYTNMTDASYALQSGTETRTFARLLTGIYFSPGEKNPDDFLTEFGARYIMSSDKILSNFGDTRENATIDNNFALDKIYSTDDFGIYEISTAPQLVVPKRILAENTTIMSIGSSFEIESPYYKMVLDGNSPSIERIGTPNENMLGAGFSTDSISISETLQKTQFVNQYMVNDLNFTHTLEGNKLTYRAVLNSTDNASEGNVGSLVVQYEFYPDSVRRDYTISNDWQGSSGTSQKGIAFSSSLFTPMSDFVIDTDQERQSRHIYESQDAVVLNNPIHDLYIHDSDVGLYIKYGSNTPFPTSLQYKGSTIYNMSSLIVLQSDIIKPGASLHSTQFFAVGDEINAERAVQNHEGVKLSNYPDGIAPVMFVGYRTPLTDQLDGNYITNGYSIIKDYKVPFTEAVNPLDTSVNIYSISSSETSSDSSTNSIENRPTIANRTVQIAPIDLNKIALEHIKIIGIQNTGINTFDDYWAQKKNINALVNYAKSQNAPLTGFMPTSLDYDLDTLKVLLDDKIPFILANSISPPVEGTNESGFRNPEIAYFYGKPTDMVLFPVSYPISSSLPYETDPEDIFSKWENIMDLAANNDEMALFIFRSDDIGNPAYSDRFINLTSYAKHAGLTVTTPDKIADHFRKLQYVDYTGTINNDEATIQITNRNTVSVRNVTFKVTLPNLKNREYQVANATITKKSIQGPWIWLYVTRDLGPNQSAQILISPSGKNEDMIVDLPGQPIEGSLILSVKDKDGVPIPNADVNIDIKHYTADKNGEVEVTLTRGTHEVTIQSPGYNSIKKVITVRGRIYLMRNILGNS